MKQMRRRRSGTRRTWHGGSRRLSQTTFSLGLCLFLKSELLNLRTIGQMLSA